MAGQKVDAVRKFAYTVKLSPHGGRTAPIKGIITARKGAAARSCAGVAARKTYLEAGGGRVGDGDAQALVVRLRTGPAR